MLKKQHLTPHDRLSRAKARLGKSKGSVLFFVIAIMSVMIVMASAVYYAVASARQEVEAKYASEQAYQSAISINDMVSDYIAADPNNKFISAALGLADGDSIKTNVTDLPAGTGNVSVTITKISGSADSAILSITTESVVNGETQVVTSVGELKEGETSDEPSSLSRFFTSTGYVPNDTWAKVKDIVSELYFDCEYTELGGPGVDNVFIKADVITSGTLRFYNNVKMTQDDTNNPKPYNLTVGNDLYLTAGGSEKLHFGNGTVRVGGSVIQTANSHDFTYATIYIQGDYYAGGQSNDNNKLYINGNLVLSGNVHLGGDVYVNGDVFVDRSCGKNSVGEIANHITVGGNLYYDVSKNFASDANADVKGKRIQTNVDFNIGSSTMIYNTQEAIEDVIAATASESGGVHGYSDIWPCKAGDTDPCESMGTVTKNIDDTLGNNKYINWELDKLFHVGEDVNNPYKDVTPIVFPADNRTFTLSAQTDDKFIIQDIDAKITEGRTALIIDTDDGAGGYKDVYIMLKPNVKYIEDTETVELPQYLTTKEKYLECPNCNKHFDCDAIPDWQQSGEKWAEWMNLPGYDKNFTCDDCGTSISEFVIRKATISTRLTPDEELNGFEFCDTIPDEYGNYNNNPMHVFVKGKGSVVFFVPNGETYVAREDSFIGHYALYELLTDTTIEDVAKQINGNGFGAAHEFSQQITSKLANNPLNYSTKKGIYEDQIIQEYIDKGLYIHNNIFLASNEKNGNINFTTPGTVFAGLIYAPYMQFNERKGDNTKAYLGGLVVSNYNLDGSQAQTYYAAPYDYYDRFIKDKNDDGSPLTEEQKEAEREKYFANLMGQTGSNQFIGGAGGGQLGRAWKKFGYN